MDRLPQVNQLRQKCAYCDGENHIRSSCNKAFAVDERKTILKEKKLCYNCPGKYHSLLNVETKDLAITAIKVTTHQLATRKRIAFQP